MLTNWKEDFVASWYQVWKNKKLWFLGLFSMGISLVSLFFSDEFDSLVSSSNVSWLPVGQWPWMFYALSFISIVLFVAYIIFSFSCRVALINSIKTNETGAPVLIKLSLKTGWFQWRKLLILSLLMYVPAVAIIVIDVLAVRMNASLWIINLCVIAFLLYNIFLSIILLPAYHHLINAKSGWWPALKFSLASLKQQPKEMLMNWLSRVFVLVGFIMVEIVGIYLLFIVMMFLSWLAMMAKVMILGQLFLILVVCLVVIFLCVFQGWSIALTYALVSRLYKKLITSAKGGSASGGNDQKPTII